MGNIQTLRRLAVKLQTSGTAEAIEKTKLYKGCYAFVWLHAYVPLTQNRTDSTAPLCTVHGLLTDTFGTRKRIGETKYNMVYVETVDIGGFKYMRYERMMPKPLTDEVGDLELVFNYSELTPEGAVSSRIASSVYHTKVEEGDYSGDELDYEPTGLEAAQINANTFDIAELQSDMNDLEQAGTELHQRMDLAEESIGELESDVLSLQNNKIDKTEKGAPQGVAPLNSSGELDGSYIKKGQAGGVATLDPSGKVPASQLDIPGTLEYRGAWNAETNTPSLTTAEKSGHYYKVDTAGEQFGKHWDIGDWIISNGTEWQKIDNSDIDAYTKEQSDSRYLQKIHAVIEPDEYSVARRTQGGQLKGAPAQNADEFVTKAQLDAIEATDILKLADATVLVDEMGRPFEDSNGRYFVPEHVDKWAREQIAKLKEGK